MKRFYLLSSLIFALAVIGPVTAFAYGTCPAASSTMESVIAQYPTLPIFTSEQSPVNSLAIASEEASSSGLYGAGILCDLDTGAQANAGYFGWFYPEINSNLNFGALGAYNGVLILSTSGFSGGTNTGLIFYTVDGSGNAQGVTAPGETNFISVNPPDQTIAATSTSFTFEATGFILSSDLSASTQISVNVYNNGQSASQLVGPYASTLVTSPFNFTDSWMATSSGYFDLSATSSVLQIGTYTMTWQISNPAFSFLGFDLGNSVLAATTTTFIVSTTTQYDQLQAQVQEQTAAFLAAETGTSTPCSLSTFDVSGCIVFLAVPSLGDLGLDFDQLRSQVLVKAPWGYATRLITIFTGTTSPTDLPTFTATIPIEDESGATSTTITYDPGDMLAGGAALLGGITDGDGHTLQSIVQPYIQLFVALSVLIIIFHDMMAMGNARKPPPRKK